MDRFINDYCRQNWYQHLFDWNKYNSANGNDPQIGCAFANCTEDNFFYFFKYRAIYLDKKKDVERFVANVDLHHTTL